MIGSFHDLVTLAGEVAEALRFLRAAMELAEARMERDSTDGVETSGGTRAAPRHMRCEPKKKAS